MRLTLLVSFSFLATLTYAEPRAEHVFVISFDGGKPKVINEAEMPVIKRLAAEGAVT